MNRNRGYFWVKGGKMFHMFRETAVLKSLLEGWEQVAAINCLRDDLTIIIRLFLKGRFGMILQSGDGGMGREISHDEHG